MSVRPFFKDPFPNKQKHWRFYMIVVAARGNEKKCKHGHLDGLSGAAGEKDGMSEIPDVFTTVHVGWENCKKHFYK